MSGLVFAVIPLFLLGCLILILWDWWKTRAISKEYYAAIAKRQGVYAPKQSGIK